MATEVILPKVDMDMATGTVSKWLVAEGALVKQGDPLFEIETDKAAMEVESPASGTLGQIVAAEGSVVPVGQPIAWIFAEGEKPGSVSAPAPSAAPEPAKKTNGAAEPIVIAAREAAPFGGRATPLARRMAREAGLDISKLAGSGPKGRVVRADIEKVVAAAPSLAPSAPTPEVEPIEPPPAPVIKSGYRQIPHDNMRKTIARRLVESKRTVPHFYLSASCRLDALLKLRTDLNASAPRFNDEPTYKLSINDMVIKAWALALRDLPMVNVSWTDESTLCHDHADIGVAVSVPSGLITPIMRQAEIKSLSAISNEMKELASRAKARKLMPEEYNGGSSAISNLGMFGVQDFTAIVNPPHATILAVGSGEERPIMENGQVVGATMMGVTLSTDHRAVDGALGAQALAAFRTYIEKPMLMLV
jgi:pyruvate dehydrogenase E2 component (dihydrolipoamide acetyltransferase)